uniref:C-type lectin domain-containing protein n=1 Tax=Sinocyclocheilus grahami TaxID=75366 RepID=A0A672QPW0_SINGR
MALLKNQICAVLLLHDEFIKQEFMVLAAAQSTGSCPANAGVPGSPGHNGSPGRDGRDGFPGTNGEKGDPGLCFYLVLGFCIFRKVGQKYYVSDELVGNFEKAQKFCSDAEVKMRINLLPYMLVQQTERKKGIFQTIIMEQRTEQLFRNVVCGMTLTVIQSGMWCVNCENDYEFLLL